MNEVKTSNTVVVQVLLDIGFDVNTVHRHKSPVKVAAERQNIELVFFLLRKRIDINMEVGNWKATIALRVRYGTPDIYQACSFN